MAHSIGGYVGSIKNAPNIQTRVRLVNNIIPCDV